MKIYTETFTDAEQWRAAILDKLNIRGVSYTSVEYYVGRWFIMDGILIAARFPNQSIPFENDRVPMLDAFVRGHFSCSHFLLKLNGELHVETNSFPQAEEAAKKYIADIETLFEEKETKASHKTEVSV
jgi:hypothetical protein